MKRLLLAAALVLSANAAFGFATWTHKQIVIDAVHYMAAHPNTTEYAKLEAAAQAAGYSMAQFTTALSEGAAAPDDFDDTYFCGAITGDCVNAPVWGAGASIVKYTSYWHFRNYTQGPDVHGNPMGGYDYDKLTVWGTVDNLAATWLDGDSLDDGPGGMTGWCFWGSCAEDSEYNTYGITEAHYRQGTYSNKGMYDDFETMPFQPITNLAEYWFKQFLAQPTVQTLGFSLHSTDLLQPHHVWVTSDLNHAGWESWVDDHYVSDDLANDALVTAALGDFTPLAANATDIRPLLDQGGEIAYSQGGIVLSSTADSDREQVAKIVVPHAIAMVVAILNRAALRF